MWLNLLEYGQPAVLQEHLSKFRILPQSMTRGRTYRVDAARDKLALLLKAAALVPLTTEARHRHREELAIARIRYALALARNGQALKGAHVAASALRSDPACIVNNRITRGVFNRSKW